MITSILLSAGESSRFGSAKALARYQNKTVIEHILITLILSQTDEIIIVLGNPKDQIEPFILKHKKVKVVYNKDHKFGQTSSFQCGVKNADISSKGFFLWPVDYPFISHKTINLLIKEHEKHPKDVLIPVYQEKKGHPPLFSSNLKEQILNIDHKVGINTLFLSENIEKNYIHIEDQGSVLTFNTEEEFRNILNKMS